ncbi:uncharacterized protein LOC127731744 isoform X2 [Mytilus californianus]|uniref:uncharacterized protein LOC127731744 isoform X2 n=1 Tax=Mytilus californianus TaxID=6549 RepID=UPI002247A55D|nr:uncharacterized protein LOC127731744 isoform X2 [Mytilus californianus]
MKFFDFKGLVGKAWAGGTHVITGNINQPIKFNLTNMEEKICDNQVTNEQKSDAENEQAQVDNTKQLTNKILNKPELKFVSNPVTWQQMSPKKEKKGSSSGSSDCSSSGDSHTSGLKTWASVKKNSVENMEMKSNSNSGHSSSTSSSSSGGSPTRTWSSIKQEANKNNVANRKDSSPTKKCLSCDSQDNEVIIKNLQNSPDHNTIGKLDENSGLDNFSFSSKTSPNHSDKKVIRKTDSNDCDNSSTSLPPGGSSQEEGFNNDYFYDEDFTVQFDTNLRESSPPNCTCPDPSDDVEFPNMVTGSYLSFKNVKSAGIINQDGHELFCPEESEISVSHHSNMDVSTSEREMMCSSDMLEFSDNPLFTPPLSGDVHMASQEDSTDSLDKAGKEKNNQDINGSQTSSDGNLNLDCFPRKEEYFLSFDGSQGHTESYSEQSNSMNSNCSSQGQNSYSQNHVNACSNEDVGDESSESFHICMSGNAYHKKPAVGSRLAKFQTLTALQEQTSELSGSSDYSDEKPCSEPVTSPTKRTFRRLSPSKGRQFRIGQKICFACHLNNSCGDDHSSPTRSRSKQKTVTSWKQVKSLKKLGKLDNILDPSRSRSMPDICLHTWSSGSSLSCHGHDVQKIAESFHCKRHSAYLLDLYQRVRNQSNPVSPECMANIEQILFHNVICKEQKLGNSSHICVFCGAGSDNTLTGSHQVSKEGKLGYYTNKRILDWLDKDKIDNRKHKSCQTESLTQSKDTAVSPTTVTLWCGTKNFGTQFPPCAKDCSIQTNVHELDDNMKDYGQQTTPTLEGKPVIPEVHVKQVKREKILKPSRPVNNTNKEEGNSLDKSDLLKLISHDFKEIDKLLPQHEFVKTKHGPIPRSKSADSTNRKQIPVPGFDSKSLFYSHKSLPDLSFINLKHLEEKQDDGSLMSLFDPLPIAMPVPVFIPAVVNSNKVTKSLSTKNSFDNLSHSCRSSSKTRGKGHRSHSAPARSHNSHLIRNCHESGSSSSGFTSSTSSGIDPGYSDRCMHNSSPTTDIERLIFYPPHVENTCKGDNLSENLSDSGNTSLHQNPERQRQHWKSSKPTDKKVNRYANEIHPGNIDSKIKTKTVKSPGTNSNTSHSSSNSSLHLEHLYSLQEEQTPVSSPERDLCHHENDYLYGNAYCVNCCKGREQGHIEHWENEEVVVRRRKFDYHIQLSSESGSSGSGSFFPNFDKKPLKSCLRKRQFLRTRSLSDHFDLGQQDEQTKEDRKKNRHSYACEEIILLQDETGEYFVCKNNEDEAEPVVFYLEDKPAEDKEKTVVKLRPKKIEEKLKDADTDSCEKELNGKRKSVSFASEVSFHAISPHMSPKRQQNSGGSEQEVMSSEQEQVISSEQQEVKSSDEEVNSIKNQQEIENEKSSSDSDEAPPVDFQVSPTGEVTPTNDHVESTDKDLRKVLLSDISSAAESLVEHFASAKNPFDKLRLGSSADTPDIGDLALSRLCPAIYRVINDGLKPHLTGVQVFGRVQVTAWKLAEASVEQGPYTRAIHDLVQQLKGHTGLVSHSNKFDAFIFGLLNLRLVDYWMGYLRHNSSIVEKYYNQDSVMSLSGTLYERKYSEVLISLQPLAVLPFQLSIEFITSRISLQGSETTSVGKDLSPKKDNSPMDHCMNDSFSKEKAIIGVAASKAWDWLKNGAAAKSPSDEIPSPPVLMGNGMISSITGILGKLSGTLKSEDKKCMEEGKEVIETTKTAVKSNADVERPILATGLVNNLQTDIPPAKPPRTSLKLELPKNESTVEAAAVDISQTGIQERRLSGDNSVQSLPSDSSTMMSSISGIAGKLLGINTEMPKKNENGTTAKKSLPVKKEKSDGTDVDLEKTKSGLIRLFDKLLLPRDSSKKEQKLKSRWSWGYGQGQQVKPLSIATKNVPVKSELKSPGQSSHSKLPAYTGKGSNSQSKGATAAVPSKLVPRTTVKLSGSSMKSSDNSLKMSSNSQEKQKESSGKTVREKSVMKSKVPVRKAASQKSVKEKSKPVEQKSDKVPKVKENKWQGGITLSASLEEGPTLKAPPSVTQMVAKFESKIDRISIEKDEEKIENIEQEVPQGKWNTDDIVKETYKDAITSDSRENTLHLSDEINCNSPNPNVATILELDAEHHLKTADIGFRKPNFRYVQSTKDSEQSGGDFSYQAGDHFEVLAQLDSDWLYCINGKKEGLIRQENVRPITDEDEFKKLHSDFYS